MVKKIQETICVVEDDPMILEIYSIQLRESGFRVVDAKDGAEGLEVIRKQRPDVAIIDINLPVMNGIELITKMESDPELSRIPVVVLTNQDDEKTVKEVSKLKSKFYLVKSMYTPEKLVGIVKEVIRSSK